VFASSVRCDRARRLSTLAIPPSRPLELNPQFVRGNHARSAPWWCACRGAGERPSRNVAICRSTERVTSWTTMSARPDAVRHRAALYGHCNHAAAANPHLRSPRTTCGSADHRADERPARTARCLENPPEPGPSRLKPVSRSEAAALRWHTHRVARARPPRHSRASTGLGWRRC